jgi:site-specific recombinase XerD
MTNEDAMTRFKADIRLRGLSERTFEGYVQRTGMFLEHFNKPVNELGEPEIRIYLLFLKENRKLANGSVNAANSALRFFFGVTLNKPLNLWQVPRLKQNREIPQLLTKSDIQRLLDHTYNPMYKAMFMTIYGSGLRISEAINLKVSDIDSKKMRIFIRQGKGGLDRFATLSHKALEALRDYWKICRPKDDLFLSRHKKKPSAHSVNNAFHKAMAEAGINKHATVHTLRHCFATHLMEDETNLFHIKKLLGHMSIRSTAWYLHFADTAAFKVTSPLDNMEESSND